MSGNCIEYRDLGRAKNQKCIVPDSGDFISCVRSLVPSAVPAIEKLVEALFADIDVHDAEECEKIGKVVVDIYNDGFVDTDFGELVKGQRGAPKTWRLPPKDFTEMIEARVGSLSEPFEELNENGGRTIETKLGGYIDEGEEEDEELLAELEG